MKDDIAASDCKRDIFNVEEVSFHPFDGLILTEGPKMTEIRTIENANRVARIQECVAQMRAKKTATAKYQTFHCVVSFVATISR